LLEEKRERVGHDVKRRQRKLTKETLFSRETIVSRQDCKINSEVEIGLAIESNKRNSKDIAELRDMRGKKLRQIVSESQLKLRDPDLRICLCHQLRRYVMYRKQLLSRSEKNKLGNTEELVETLERQRVSTITEKDITIHRQ
jgi:hypothetical protein